MQGDTGHVGYDIVTFGINKLMGYLIVVEIKSFIESKQSVCLREFGVNINSSSILTVAPLPR